jgi:hypothetical protein
MANWEVEVTDQFEEWWDDLPEEDQEKITAAVRVLQQRGPALGRPLVGEVIGSRHGKNMKELIPPASSLRILFLFDPRRAAILLTGGDKEGQWEKFYDRMIPVADDLYDVYLQELRQEGVIE